MNQKLVVYGIVAVSILILIAGFMKYKTNTKKEEVLSVGVDDGGSYPYAVVVNDSGDLDKVNRYDAFVPKGTIVMWHGQDKAPQGWAFCDGGEGRPDLRGRFILSSTYSNTVIGFEDKVGNTAGERNVTLTVEQIPSHAHDMNNKQCALTRKSSSGQNFDGGSFGNCTPSQQFTQSTGGSQPHNNMPPYYVLAYIIKL
jgi:hypothetical protein